MVAVVVLNKVLWIAIFYYEREWRQLYFGASTCWISSRQEKP